MNRHMLWMRLAGAVLGLCIGSSAYAISGADRVRLGNTIIPNGTVNPNFSAGSVTFNGTSAAGSPEVTRIGHTWDAQPSRQTRLNENYQVKAGGNLIDYTRRTTVPPLAIQKASALALKALPVVATGVALWDLWNAIRVGPDGEGGLVSDAGVPPVVESNWAYAHTSSTHVSALVHSTSAAACAAWVPAGYVLDSCVPGTVGTCVITGVGSTTCQVVTATAHAVPGVPYTSTGYLQGAIIPTAPTCPPSVDPYDPAYSLPGGLPVGADGKCRQARGHWAPISHEAAAAKNEAGNPPDGEALKGMAEDALARGQTIPDATVQDGSGPASVTGSPTTTTTTPPGGGPSTTTTKTPTVSYTYAGDTINYYVTTVTVTNTGGSVTTTTETEAPEEKPECKDNPDSLGCSKMGTPPTDAPSWESRNVVFAPEDLGFSGACPAPESWEVFGMTLTWAYDPICDVAPFIRFALLAFAGIGAIGVVIRETNS